MTQNVNQLLSEVQNLLTIAAMTNSYTYDSDGQRLKHTYPAGSVITNTYTARNQIASISADGPPPLATFAYDGGGNRTTKTLENGTSVEYFYNDASRMTSLMHKTNGTSFASFAYAYNSVGNRTNRTESSAGFQPVTDAYTYDATDQIASVNYNASQRVVSYQWDAVGNRTTVTDNGVGTNYTANSLNQYTAIGGGSPTYDTKGNFITQNGWTYTFDAQNRLLTAEPTSPVDGNQKMLFAYDARNRCVHRQTYTRITGNWSLITDYFLIYDNWNLIEEWTTGGAQVAHYVHGPRMDELLVKVSTTNAVYYHHDGLGNTTHLTATNGAVVERYTYDVFGKPTILAANSQLLSASSFANRFLFTGREWLAEISLYDYRNRIYSPDLGRFLQTDPIRFEAGDVNIYRYCGNDPMDWIDPDGLFVFPPIFVGPMQPGDYIVPTPPSNIPGGPWTWFPNPQNTRGGVYMGPPGPRGQRYILTWAPPFTVNQNNDPYWTGIDPSGRQRFDANGNPITWPQAHGGTGTPPNTMPIIIQPINPPPLPTRLPLPLRMPVLPIRIPIPFLIP